jgi:hypothetical protein
MPRTTVTETTYTDKDGNEKTQYRTTVPKGLAEAYNLGGASLEWEADTGKSLRLRVVDE